MGIGYIFKRAFLFLVIGSVAVAVLRGGVADPKGALDWFKVQSNQISDWAHGVSGSAAHVIDTTPKPGSIIPTTKPTKAPSKPKK